MSDLTKKAIKQSFRELVSVKPAGQITIKELTDHCGLSRNTFYYHYESIVNLVEEIVLEDNKAIISMIDFDHIDSVEAMDHCFDSIVDVLLKYRSSIYNIYVSSTSFLYDKVLWHTCDEAIGSFIQKISGIYKIPDHEKENLIIYLSCLSYGVLVRWIQEGMKEEDARRIKDFFHMRIDMHDYISAP